ncbi:MAG: acyltransferase [Mameliella sp.]|nr:acyltransferase [Mameliella sp.]|tara:strand:+ start:2492 stop:4528 length:2037 start_codon:yes stop_codon:yes gene_type:complete
MDYRRDIDGLRAIAVLPVILFHAGFSWFSGGFVGVDVFFVISGFLITSLLAEDLRQGRFSIGRFYERRVRRILPALFLVILVCIPFAWLWMLPADFEDFAGSLSITIFLSNQYFMNEVDYFNTEADLQPLLHTWSLAVEEQYYLFFPPLLWLVWKTGRRGTLAIVSLLVAISLVVAVIGAATAPDLTFYFSPARFWEIGIGSICALFLLGRKRRQHGGATALGLALIAYAVVFYDKTVPMPSFWTLPPVLGTALVLLFGGSACLAGRLLCAAPVVGIGLISYSAYLWHQPLFAFARLYELSAPPPSLMLLLSVLSLMLAWLTWWFVERPFRRRERPFLPRRPVLFSSFAALGTVILAFGVWGFKSEGLPQRLPDRARAFAAFEEDRSPQRDLCLLTYRAPVPDLPLAGCGLPNASATNPDVVLIGDSHSNAFARQAQIALVEAGFATDALAYSGCPAIGGLVQLNRKSAEGCLDYQRQIVASARSRDAKAVIVSIRWPGYLSGYRYDNGEGGVEAGPTMTADLFDRYNEKRAPDDPQRRADVLAAYEAGLRDLSSEFAVVVVDPVPEVGWNVPRAAALCELQGRQSCRDGHSYDNYLDRNRPILQMLDRLEREGLIHRAEIAPAFCDTIPGGRCRMFDDVGQPLYFDDDHLAHGTGAVLIAPVIVDALRRALLVQEAL